MAEADRVCRAYSIGTRRLMLMMGSINIGRPQEIKTVDRKGLATVVLVVVGKERTSRLIMRMRVSVLGSIGHRETTGASGKRHVDLS